MIRKKFIYTIGLLAVIMAVSSSIFVYLIARAEQDVGKLASMAHPLQVATLEIEINVTQSYSEALNYSNRRYEKHKNNWPSTRSLPSRRN